VKRNLVKFFVIMAVAAVLISSSIIANAAYETEDTYGGGDSYNGLLYEYYSSSETDEEYIVITGAEYLDGNVTIPSQISVEYGTRTLPVRVIAKYAFYGEYITSVSIPSSVKTIEESAFANCTRLTSVTLANGIERIGAYAFNKCTSLKSISIPNSVTQLGGYAFYNCESLTSATIGSGIEKLNCAFELSGLTSITVPDTVTSLSDGEFTACLDLKSVHIGSGVQEIGTAFIRTLSLEQITISPNNRHFTVIDGILYTKDEKELVAYPQNKAGTSLTVKDTVEIIRPYAVNYPQNLTSLTVSEGVKSIGKSAFKNAEKINYVFLPISLKEIGAWAFAENTALTEINLPISLESIGEYAFNRCSKLTTASIPDSVTGMLGECTFGNCISLESVYIGSGITEIKLGQTNAFMDCSALTTIKVSAENNNYKSIAGNLYSKDKKLFLKYAQGKTSTSFTMAEGVESVADYAFDAANNLTSIVLADSVQSMGTEAIYDCTSLVYTTVDGANYIPSATNQYHTLVSVTSSVTNVVLDKTKVIRPGAFSSASSLRSVVIGDSITVIPDELFKGKTGLTTVTLGKSLKTIGESAFSGCTALQSISFPDSLTSIGGAAFYNCSKLSGDLVIPDGVTEIKGSTFYGCNYITSITLGKNTTSIGANAFRSLLNVKSINIPATVTSVGSDAFNNFGSSYYGLKVYVEDLASWCKIDFASNTANPFNCLYTDKTELYINNVLTTEIVIPDGITEIKNYAFYKTPVTSITLNDKIETIGIEAFAYNPATKMIIPDSVKNINAYAFYYARANEITLGDGLEYIGQYAFHWSYATKVTFGSCSPYVDFRAFYRAYVSEVHTTDLAAWCSTEFYENDGNPLTRCNKLYYNGELVTELVVPDGVTVIGETTFYKYTPLTKVHIPDSVKEINADAFYGCTGITELFIGSGIESIPNSAFVSCSALSKITYHGTPEQWATVSAKVTAFSKADVDCVFIVTVLDDNGDVVVKKYLEAGKPISSTELGLDANGYDTIFYTDAQHKNALGRHEKLVSDITVYYAHKPPKETSTTANGNTFTIIPKNFDEGETAKIVVALYAENQLVDSAIADCTTGETTITFDSSVVYDYAKIMVWDLEYGLEPITHPEIIGEITKVE